MLRQRLVVAHRGNVRSEACHRRSWNPTLGATVDRTWNTPEEHRILLKCTPVVSYYRNVLGLKLNEVEMLTT